MENFPGGSVVKNLPANAGETDLVPGQGRSHMQRGNEARVTQLCTGTPKVKAPQQEKTLQEACARQLERSHCLQLEKVCTQWASRQPKKKKKPQKQKNHKWTLKFITFFFCI